VQLFFQANKIAKEKKQVPVLLSMIEEKTRVLLSDLLTPKKPASKSYDELQEALQNTMS